MKKFLSAILAVCMIAATAGCGSDDTAETTTAAEGAAAEEGAVAEENAAADEEKVETTSINTPEMLTFIDTISKDAPIYANYLKESGEVPSRTGFAYSADLYGTGTESKVEMEVYMASLEKIAIKTITDGVSSDIIMNNGTYYILSGAEKQALYMTLGEEESAAMSEQMATSMVPAFDAATATFTSGTEEFNGTEYLFERITTAEAGEIVVYADKTTKEVKHLVSGGVAMEVTFFDHNVDDAVFEVPADYELIDMATALGGATEAE